MTPTFTTLSQLSYTLECVALNYLGEAKSSLAELCRDLESNSPEYAIQNRELIARQLRSVLEAFQKGDNQAGTSLLVQINRALWQS